MSIRGRVHRLLGKFDRRLTLVEDAAERIEGAVMNILDITTEFKATVARLERAIVEQGRTVSNALDGMHDERERRAAIGRTVMQHDVRLDRLESRRIPGEPNGGAPY